MPADYENFRNTSSLSLTDSGYQITRTIYLRAETEIDAVLHPDAPKRGDSLSVPVGSAYTAIIYCNTVNVKAVEAASGKGTGFLWEVQATYSPLTKSNPQGNKARWEVGFRSQKYTLRYVTEPDRQTRAGPGSPEKEKYPEVTTGINVTEDGPQGVEVDEMVEVLTIEFWKYPEDVDAFLAAVRTVGDTVNAADFSGPWGTYAAGEARITGVTVGGTKGELVSVQVEISRMKNDSEISITLDSMEAPVTISKSGWEYVWIRYIKGTKDSTDNDVRSRSIDAFVANIYDTGDYSVLGISPEIWV